MKRFLLYLFLLVSLGTYAQDERKHELSSEFTACGYAGFFNNGYRVSGGVNIDGKRSAGLMLGYHDSYHDDAPGDVYSIVTALYYRRYFPFGQHGRFAFYVDAYVGAEYVYKVTGKYGVDLETGKVAALFDYSPGDVFPIWGVHPGFRVRLYKNLNIFFGPSVGTDCIGIHFGIGF